MKDSEIISNQMAIIQVKEFEIKRLRDGNMDLSNQNSDLMIDIIHLEKKLKDEKLKNIYVSSYIENLKKRPKFIYIINRNKSRKDKHNGSEQMTEELKPCPFCGNNEEEKIQIFVTIINWFYVECGACLSESPHCEIRNDAIIWWNTRDGEIK